MDGALLQNVMLGLETAVDPSNLIYCFIGVFLGTLIGVLPGIGALAAISMLLADHLLSRADRGAHHAGRHLLRRRLRRLDRLDPAQPAGHALRRPSPASTAIRWRGRAAPASRCS